MAVALTELERLQIPFIRTLRSVVREMLAHQDISPENFLVAEDPSQCTEQDIPTFHEIRTALVKYWPAGKAFGRYSAELLSATTETAAKKITRILVRDRESKNILLSYDPQEYVHIIHHLEGRLKGQYLHLLNALKEKGNEN